MKRNGIISFWKFVFSIIIVIFHGAIFAKGNEIALFRGGYIGVEFFFIVSGVLLASSIIKVWDNDDNLGIETWKFIWKKFTSFFPYVFLAFVFSFIFVFLFNNYSLHQLVSSIWGLFLLAETGLKSVAVNIPVWYLSSMLLSMVIIYPLMRKFKMNYVYFFVPFIVLFGFGFMNQSYYKLDEMNLWLGFSYFTNIRAFVELNLGILIYFIANKIKDIKFTFIGRLSLTIIEFITYMIPIVIALFVKNSYRYDYFLILLIAIGVCISFSEKTLEYKIFSNKLIFFLERLSLSVYLFHCISSKIIYYIGERISIPYSTKISIHVLASLIIALIMLKTVEYLKKKNYFIDKFKYIFIEQ